MRTATANFNTENAKLAKSPVWVITLTGLPSNRGNFSSGDFSGITSDYKKHLKSMNVRLIQIDMLEPETDLTNEYEFEIADKDLTFTGVVKDYDLMGREVTVKLGFAALAIGDFVSIGSLTIDSVELLEDNLTWRVTARDYLFKLKGDLFTNLPETALNGSIAIGVATVTVDDATSFHAGTGLPQWVKSCILIDQELKSYTGKTATTFTGCASIGLTGDVAHNDNAVVKQAYAFACDPLTVLLHVLTTTDGGANGPYDLGLTRFGLGITESQINWAVIEKLGWKIFDVSEYSTLAGWPATAFIAVTKKEKSPEWIETFCLKPGSCYLYVSAGKLDVDALDYVWWNENFASDKDLTTSDILGLKLEFGDVINLFQTHYNRNPVTEETKASWKLKLDDSVTQYGQSDLPFDQLIPGNVITTYSYQQWTRRICDIYGDLSGNVETRLTMRGGILLEPNDDIRITYTKVPDLKAGTRGWTNQKVKVTGVEIDMLGEVTVKGVTWELFNRVSGLANGIYTVNKVTAGIDDTAVAFSADKTTTTEAADGYYNNYTTSHDADLVIVWLNVQEPAGSAGHQRIGVRLQTLYGPEAAPVTLLDADDKNYIRYNATGGTLHNLPLYLHGPNSGTSIIRVKADWFYRSTADVNEVPTVSIDKIWFVLHRRAMSAA